MRTMYRRVASPVGVLRVGIWMGFCMLCGWLILPVVELLSVRVPVTVVVVVSAGDGNCRVVGLSEEVVGRSESGISFRDGGVGVAWEGHEGGIMVLPTASRIPLEYKAECRRRSSSCRTRFGCRVRICKAFCLGGSYNMNMCL